MTMDTGDKTAADWQDREAPLKRERDASIGDAALYDLGRVRRRLDELAAKARWDASDTADFDCMHYLGDAALETAGQTLGMQQGQTVVDVGSGFSATGRYLHRKYGVHVTGVELQPEVHELADVINQRNGLAGSVRSINVDFNKASLGAPVDYIVSFLCILHIPDRDALFRKAAETLKLGGRIYIEDYFARTTPLSRRTRDQLRDTVCCPYLPSREQYMCDLSSAGFRDVRFDDVTGEWAEFVHERAVRCRQEGTTTIEAPLAFFYDTVDALFASGQLGGARITATKG
ncbi:methyl transferase-like protein [Metarhizium rileyi]|uniref:phosphoethanolamine N-methyltransferase n=1 Tax=Metarhizium rileyi (strain RCEF 4871) TaxID=1649241 RepID=A0A166ZEP6_METRR|nr:methyl transferase-like protein [Metarhizium rileyi RCEF 4871]TWU74302.1 hypothetical protein ED733_005594 [Metarhizium rileyi]